MQLSQPVSVAAGVLFQAPRGPCGIPRVPIATYSMHGGAGALLSIGLLRAIDFEAFEDCVLTTYSTGGDAFISICLWQVRACIMPHARARCTLPDNLAAPSILGSDTEAGALCILDVTSLHA